MRWERRPEERPKELLEAALSMFAERGYRNTRLEEIAEVAGVTKGTIYHYFDTKEELLLRAVQHYQAQWLRTMQDFLRSEKGSAAERIRRFIAKIFGGDPSRRKMFALLMQGVTREVPAVHREWLSSGPVKAWQLLAQVVKEGQDAGDFRTDVDVDVMCRVLISGLILQLYWQTHAEGLTDYSIDESRLLDASVDTFLAGLETRDQSSGLAARTRYHIR